MLALLEKANKEVKKELLTTTGIETKKRYTELAVAINAISRDLRDNINECLDNPDFIDEEIAAQEKILRGQGLTNFYTPNTNTIRTAAQFKPFADTANYESFLNGIKEGFYNTWDSAIRTGYLTGETTQKIIKTVMGEIAKDANLAHMGTVKRLRDSIERNTRTYLQAMATVTRERVYLDNESLFSGYQYTATLDTRTCLVCGMWDGVIKSDIKDFPQTPQHYNCRCLLIPQVKGLENVSETRASIDGYVSSDISFESWLENQPDAIQQEVLGAARYKLYKEDKLTLDKFVQDNRVLTLTELKTLYS